MVSATWTQPAALSHSVPLAPPPPSGGEPQGATNPWPAHSGFPPAALPTTTSRLGACLQHVLGGSFYRSFAKYKQGLSVGEYVVTKELHTNTSLPLELQFTKIPHPWRRAAFPPRMEPKVHNCASDSVKNKKDGQIKKKRGRRGAPQGHARPILLLLPLTLCRHPQINSAAMHCTLHRKGSHVNHIICYISLRQSRSATCMSMPLSGHSIIGGKASASPGPDHCAIVNEG